MGSLPNLHTISASERPPISRLFDPSPVLQQRIRHATAQQQCNVRGSTQPHRHHGHHYHHRPVQQTRSAGHATSAAAPSGWDDFLLEQMASYSPISSRSTRSTATAHSGFTAAAHVVTPFPTTGRGGSGRRDSLSSSGGASSVRRLIAVVRSTPSRLGPVYSRRVLLRNFVALCLGHATTTAALLPLVALQSSISAWWWRPTSPSSDAGALLLAALFATASVSSLIAPTLVQRIGSNWTLILGYVHACVFFGLHLYPLPYTLIPGYFIMGLWLGPLVSAKITFLMTLASKLCYMVTEDDEAEETEEYTCRRETVVRRLARGLQIAQDFGLVLGNVVTALLLWYTLPSIENDETTYSSSGGGGVLDAMFAWDESGERICGSEACPFTTVSTLTMEVPETYPLSVSTTAISRNVTVNASLTTPSSSSSSTLTIDWGLSASPQVFVLPCKSSAMLASVFLGCSVMGVALTAAFLDRIRMFVYQDPLERPTGVAALRAVKNAFRDPRLQLAAPLAVFIGLEQGFMYADFSKSYVVCALGVPNISLVFLSLGLLQSLAAFTLSMMLRHVRRYLVISVGFVFHACLLLVLLLWKPSGDDPALFYVISAAWGVCNAIWETLNFTLLVTVYPDAWQAPLAHCYFFRFLGLALAFGLHGGVCNWLKLYALAAALVLAVTPYSWLEMQLESHRRLKTHLVTL